MKVSTAKIIALRSLDRNISKELPIWACAQLEDGTDSPYLRIAAGHNGNESSSEAEQVMDRAMEELKLTRWPADRAWRIYVVESYKDYKASGMTKRQFLGVAWKACIEQNYPKDLTPLYLIYSGYDDLEKQGWSFECPNDVTRENVDSVIASEVQKLERALQPV